MCNNINLRPGNCKKDCDNCQPKSISDARLRKLVAKFEAKTVDPLPVEQAKEDGLKIEYNRSTKEITLTIG